MKVKVNLNFLAPKELQPDVKTITKIFDEKMRRYARKTAPGSLLTPPFGHLSVNTPLLPCGVILNFN